MVRGVATRLKIHGGKVLESISALPNNVEASQFLFSRPGKSIRRVEWNEPAWLPPVRDICTANLDLNRPTREGEAGQWKSVGSHDKCGIG